MLKHERPAASWAFFFKVLCVSEPFDIHLFSYGTLQLESVQLSSFGRRLHGTPDALPGYARTMVEIADPQVLAASGERFHLIVAPSDDPADEVQGAVFRISASELAHRPKTNCATTSATLSPVAIAKVRPKSVGA